jgi:hypothetical protein
MVSAAANAGVRAAANGAPDHTDTGSGDSVMGVFETAQGSAPSDVVCDSCITVTPSQSERTATASPVWTTVTIAYTFDPLTPLTARLIGSSPVTITRSASQRVRVSCALADATPC